MLLKNYQTRTLDALQLFFKRARLIGHKEAYEEITVDPEFKVRLGKFRGYTVWDSIPNTPRVCIKVPTGGGKTILATHAIKLAGETWMDREFPLVLWFVPGEAIRQQTVEALKNPRHPYRQALDEQFNGRVCILDISEKFQLSPQDIGSRVCIIVSTVQAFKQSATDKYNVYKHNENLEPHFSNIMATEGMDKDEYGKLKFSFANLLHAHRPLMIIDEAHNVVTSLSREMQGRLNPSAIIEMTATPRINNNILYNVFASELKEESMIKLPIMLKEHREWEMCVTESVAKRTELEQTCGYEKEYIRPILLLQAESKGEDSVTCDVLKAYLTDDLNIPEGQIAIATGEQRELDGINVFDRACPIRYIITMQALKEGWDCSFAYVLCSITNIKSDTAVEQLLGRVMRMPYATTRRTPALNKSYAYVKSSAFGEAARELVQKLSNKGFDDKEAEQVIVSQTPDLMEGWWENDRIVLPPNIPVVREEVPSTLIFTPLQNGSSIISFTQETPDEDIEKVARQLPSIAGEELRQKFKNYKNQKESAYERNSFAKNGQTFCVPRLMAEIQGELEWADTETIFEVFDWKLPKYASPQLLEMEFRAEKKGDSFVVDLDGHRITVEAILQKDEFLPGLAPQTWTMEALVHWLDKKIKQPDISQNIMVRWLTDAVHYLHIHRQIPMEDLMMCKFILMNKLFERIRDSRAKAKKDAWQMTLFDSSRSRVEISFSHGFEFFESMYDDLAFYKGQFKFSKHYLGAYKVPMFDGKGEKGEEFHCAQVLDSLPEVKFWLRNAARHPQSFWLPTSKDRFYPDFVAELQDGRLLVVEYKGAHLASNEDTAEKESIGSLWEKASQGKGLFLIAEKSKKGLTIDEQLKAKINGSL